MCVWVGGGGNNGQLVSMDELCKKGFGVLRVEGLSCKEVHLG